MADNQDRGQQHASQQSFSSSPLVTFSQSTPADTDGLVQVTTAIRQIKTVYTLARGNMHEMKTVRERRMRQQRCQRVAVPILVALLPHKEAKLFFYEVICICHRQVTLTEVCRESIKPSQLKKVISTELQVCVYISGTTVTIPDLLPAIYFFKKNIPMK